MKGGGGGAEWKGKKIPWFPDNCTDAALGELSDTSRRPSGHCAPPPGGPLETSKGLCGATLHPVGTERLVFSSHPLLFLGGLLGPTVQGNA